MEEAVMFESEIFRHFKETIPNIHRVFDVNHFGEQEELAEYVSKIYTILARVVNYPDRNKITDVEFTNATMLWRGTNTIVASFELTRSGYGIEPPVVLRNALETCSTAIDLFRNPKKYRDFKERKYKSSGSISEAKKILPIIGMFYGMFSEFYSHVNVISSLPQYYKDETGTTVFTTGGAYVKENEPHLNINLSLISLLLSIYLASAEYIFFKFCEKSEFWQKVNINLLEFNPIKEERERNRKREEKILRALAALNVNKK